MDNNNNTIKRIMQLLIFAVGLVHIASGFFCHPEDIKKCLEPSLHFLQNQTGGNSSHPREGLLQTAIMNYFSVLDKSNDSGFHSISVEAVLVQLDHIFSDPDLLTDGCSVFKETEKCLILKEDWCDGEMRDDLQGIENIFNMICHQKYMEVFEADHACLDNEALETERATCDTQLARTLGDIGEVLYRTTVREGTTKFGEYYNMPVESQPCKSVHGAVDCYVEKVKEACGEDLAKWEKRLRHSLVQFLLVDLNCGVDEGDFDYFEPLADESQYFVCLSKEDYISADKKCDKTPDCRDGSDEIGCGKIWTLLDILLLSIGVIAALVIIVMCVVKWREDIAFTLRYHLSLASPREMQTFVTEEEQMGESTPPPGKTFQYDQLSPSHMSTWPTTRGAAKM